MKKSKRGSLALLTLTIVGGMAVGTLAAKEPEAPAGEKTTPQVHWRIRGDLSEACTCSVPCSCNFGQGPSPQHYCYAVFAYGIRKGNYGKVKLDGLKIGGAMGEKGIVIFLDERATPEQAAGLKAIIEHIGSTIQPDPATPDAPSPPMLGIQTASIEQTVGEKSCRLQIANLGGFESDYLIGIDGKRPITVENNWSWNVTDCIKAKARQLKWKDSFGNTIDAEGVNSNQGKFDYTEKTTLFIR
jgi:hypothetical protein